MFIVLCLEIQIVDLKVRLVTKSSVTVSLPTILSTTPPCVSAYVNICAHVKDPVVHVRVQWIIEILKHLACTVGWVA